jgi:hypothetical protein
MKFGVTSALALGSFLAVLGTKSASSSANAFATTQQASSFSSRQVDSSLTTSKSVGHIRQSLATYGGDLSLPFPKTSRSTRSTTTTTTTTSQLAAATVVNGDSSKKAPTLADSFLSASLLIALDVGFRKLFQALSISFPSSLGGCCALFVSMLLLPMGSSMFSLLSPGAALLAKWLPVFFVPSLITLPLVGSIGPPTEVCTASRSMTHGRILLRSSNTVSDLPSWLDPFFHWKKRRVGLIHVYAFSILFSLFLLWIIIYDVS